MSLASDHPLFAHVRAQKRFGAILRESYSFERQGAGAQCQISSLHSNTKEPSFSHTGVGGGMRGDDVGIFGGRALGIQNT